MIAQVDFQYIKKRPSRLWARVCSYLLFEGRPLTTKGQWINPLVFAIYSVARRLPQLKAVQAPIYIVGAGRSGTTILGILLSMHRDVGYLNEPKAMWHAGTSGGEDLIGSYDRGPAQYRLEAKDATLSAKLAMHRQYGFYLRAAFSTRVVDKYPELVFRSEFVSEIFPTAKFIFIARNGYDACISVEDWSARLGEERGGEVHDWWGVNDRKWNLLVDQIVPEHDDLVKLSPEMRSWSSHHQRAIVEWIVTMREGYALAAAFPQRVLHVPYEALCADPQKWICKIKDFTGLRHDEVCLEYATQKLVPVTSKKRGIIQPNLMPQFVNTMEMLGYEV